VLGTDAVEVDGAQSDRGRPAADVGACVEHRGVRIGTVVDVIFDARVESVIGYEVACLDGVARFAPFVACGRALPACLEITAPTAMLGDEALPYYRERGVSLAALEAPIQRAARVELQALQASHDDPRTPA